MLHESIVRRDRLRVFEEVDEMLASPEVDAVAVGTPLAERGYWCERVARAGKYPLCLAPLAEDAGEVRQIVEHCVSLGRPVRAVDRSDVGSIAAAMEEAGWRCGRVVFFSLDIQLARSELEKDDCGVVMDGAGGYLGRLDGVFEGGLDEMWAESRSLLWGRRREDVAVAYVRALDGGEGTISVCALGDHTEARLRLYGRAGTLDRTDNPPMHAEDAWRAAYAEFSDVRSDQRVLPLSGEQLEAGAKLCKWLERAARARRWVSRKEKI